MHTHARTHAHTYILIHVNWYIHIYILRTHARTHTRTYTHTHTRTRTHTHTHTHTHTFQWHFPRSKTVRLSPISVVSSQRSGTAEQPKTGVHEPANRLKSRFGLAARRQAGKQKNIGSIPLRLSSLFKSCGLLALSRDFVHDDYKQNIQMALITAHL